MPSTYTPIASTTVASDSATVTFSGISGTYTDLILVSSWKSPSSTLGNISLSIRFNGDANTNYSFTNMYGNGSSVASSRSSNASQIILNYTGSPYMQYNAFITNIMNYSNTTTYKTVVSRDSNPSVGGNGGNGGVGTLAGLWRNTSAITSITLRVDSGATGLASNSTFTLYGIKAA